MTKDIIGKLQMIQDMAESRVEVFDEVFNITVIVPMLPHEDARRLIMDLLKFETGQTNT